MADAQRAGTDRRDRHQHSEHRAEEDGQRRCAAWAQLPDMGDEEGQDLLAQDQHCSSRGERAAQHRRYQAPRGTAVNAEGGQRKQSHRGYRHAAGGEPADDAPVDVPVEPVHQGAAALCRRRVEQVGPDRGGGVDAEEEDQQRGHQRATANPGHADQQADAKARDRKKQVDRVDHGADAVGTGRPDCQMISRRRNSSRMCSAAASGVTPSVAIRISGASGAS